MSIKLSTLATGLISVVILTGCQTPLKSTALNQSIEEPTITSVPDIPDSDNDGVTDEIDHCPKTPINFPVDELGCPMLVELSDLITVETRIFFVRDSSALQAKFFPELEKVAEKMLNSPDLDLVVVLSGHTSKPEALQLTTTTGENPKQRTGGQFQLGHERAQLVKSYLINKGVPTSKIYSFDCADNMPVASNDTEEGASMNQWVYGKALPANDFFTGEGYGHTHSFESYKSLCQQF